MLGLGLGLGFSRMAATAGAPGLLNISPPTISGIPMTGATLVGMAGNWSGSPTLTYQWQYDNVGTWSNIAGATSRSGYTVPLAREGQAIRLLEIPDGDAGGAVASNTITLGIGLHWLAADNPANTEATVNQTFSPLLVNTTTNEIEVTSLAFDFINVYSVTPVYFSSTGTLPAPLVAGRPYYVKNTGTGLAIYPCHTSDADYAMLPGYVDGETVLPALSFALDINRIDLTSQGTGTHTIYSNPIVTVIADKTGNNNGYSESNLQNALEKITDGYGAYLKTDGGLAQRPDMGSAGTVYGKLISFDGNKTALGNKLEGSRYVWSVMALRLRRRVCQYQERSVVSSTKVNAATGVITATGHSFATGRLLQKGVFGSGALPGGMPAGDVYARSVTSNTFTLHPTAADANANTNILTYTNTGSGLFWFLDNTEAKNDCTRQVVFDLNHPGGNDHRFSPQLSGMGDNLPLSDSSYFMTGGSDGNINFTLGPESTGTNWTVLKVKVFIPPGAVGPTRRDTGLPLTSGTYWVTATPNSLRYLRLHATEANAIANVGVSTSSATCIKYSALGTGVGAIAVADASVFRPFDDLATYADQSAVNVSSDNDFGVFAMMRDYLGNGVNQKYFAAKDNLWNLMNGAVMTNTTALAAGLAPGDGSSQIHFINTNEPHIPGRYDIYEIITGCADADPTTIIQKCLDELKTKYGAA